MQITLDQGVDDESVCSRLSAHDVTLEDIVRLVGHSGTAVTERVYRHEIRPSLTQGAEILDQLFQ